jgi:hypothetical protein
MQEIEPRSAERHHHEPMLSIDMRSEKKVGHLSGNSCVNINTKIWAALFLRNAGSASPPLGPLVSHPDNACEKWPRAHTRAFVWKSKCHATETAPRQAHAKWTCPC